MSADLQDTCVTGKALRVITCDAELADSSYMIYSAMKRAEIDQPDLLKLPLWNAYKASAWAWFVRAFEVI